MFSDTPAPDSETIEVPEPNVGDAVEMPPPPLRGGQGGRGRQAVSLFAGRGAWPRIVVR